MAGVEGDLSRAVPVDEHADLRLRVARLERALRLALIMLEAHGVIATATMLNVIDGKTGPERSDHDAG